MTYAEMTQHNCRSAFQPCFDPAILPALVIKAPLVWATRADLIKAIDAGFITSRKIADHLGADIACVSAELLKMSRAAVVVRRMSWCKNAQFSCWHYSIGPFTPKVSITKMIRDYVRDHPVSCCYEVAEGLGMLPKNVSSKLSSLEIDGHFTSVLKPHKTRRVNTKFYSIKEQQA